MKRITIVIINFIFSGLIAVAQVGINNDNSLPDASAGLDVKFTNKGFLPPRVSLTALNSTMPITSPAAGLLVYNTVSAGTAPNNVMPGYYFWNGTKWISASVPQGANTGEMLYWNGTQWIIVPTGSEGQILTYVNGTPTWQYKCGTPIVKSHVAGTVAPVSKTVTYGTIDNIPGEPYKCWITSNLGADHQAMGMNDPTEASAGWYWQFNRKQGYKHDGTTRTPAMTWIVSISDTTDWQTINDPCKTELGSQWRIPTYTEWNNVDNAGGWSNLNDTWNYGLKLHAAGYLQNSDGSLSERGTAGRTWSSTKNGAGIGWNLGFDSSTSLMTNLSMDYGQSVRCLRD